MAPRRFRLGLSHLRAVHRLSRANPAREPGSAELRATRIADVEALKRNLAIALDRLEGQRQGVNEVIDAIEAVPGTLQRTT
jgi:hypothetical protein